MAFCRHIKLNKLFLGTLIFIIILVFLQIITGVYLNIFTYTQFFSKDTSNIHLEDPNIPVVLWWTPFTGEKSSVKNCGLFQCVFTEDRKYWHQPQTKALMFYGSKFDVLDLPLPRRGMTVAWALLHEESPKNTPLLSHAQALGLFNYTATFSRRSSFPLTLQYLQDAEILMGHKYFVPLARKNMFLVEIAPVLYIHSDCNTPLERDTYVSELMRYIPVDSYGSCLQNKKLPEHLANPMEGLQSDEFYHFVARYKFTLAFENSVCVDYITEKLWRPLIVGSVPIYMGSPSVRDWLPNWQSAILASDYDSPKELADFLHTVNANDSLYVTYLQHKLGNKIKISNDLLLSTLQTRKWGIDDNVDTGNMVEHFECFVCDRINQRTLGEEHVANLSHYDCPSPISPLTQAINRSNWWVGHWEMGNCEASTLMSFVQSGKNYFSRSEFYSEVQRLFVGKVC